MEIWVYEIGVLAVGEAVNEDTFVPIFLKYRLFVPEMLRLVKQGHLFAIISDLGDPFRRVLVHELLQFLLWGV